jgi:hypothetical protein
MVTKISYRMQDILDRCAKAGGSIKVISGFRTFEALERRGLIKLSHERRPGNPYRQWYIDLTDAGKEKARNA